jgi:hypothetical protein
MLRNFSPRNPLSCLVVAAISRTAAAEVNTSELHAILGVRVVTGTGEVLDRVDLVIRDGLIQAMGPDLSIPAEAVPTEGRGLTVHAGFVDGYTHRGLELSGGPEPVPGRNEGSPPDFSAEALAAMEVANRKGIHPQRRASDLLAGDESFGEWRNAGFTAALCVPEPGLLKGRGCLVDLSARPPREAIVTEPQILFAELSRRDRDGYPSTVMGNLAHLRQVLLDTGRLGRWRRRFEASPRGTPRPPHDSALAALLPVLEGRQRVAFEADSESDIRRALDFAREFDLDPVIVGAREGYRVAELLARRGTPVIAALDFGEEPRRRGTPEDPEAPNPEGPSGVGTAEAGSSPDAAPEEGEHSPDADPVLLEAEKLYAERVQEWREHVGNVPCLLAAGVRVGLTTRGFEKPADFLEALRTVLADGLDPTDALAALTTTPAELLGVRPYLGTVETGMAANLVLRSGEFPDPGSTVRWVFVGGRRFPGGDSEAATGDTKPLEVPATFELHGLEGLGRRFEAVLDLEEGDEGLQGFLEVRVGRFPVVRGRRSGDGVELVVEVVFARLRQEFELSLAPEGDGLRGELRTSFGALALEGTRCTEEPR